MDWGARAMVRRGLRDRRARTNAPITWPHKVSPLGIALHVLLELGLLHGHSPEVVVVRD